MGNIDENPRVSIGVPVYNAEVFLATALESLLAQTFKDFEVIISDNASTDATQEICEHFAAKDKRIKYHRNDINLGAAKNFNLVFQLSNGEYFKWMAYDDPIAPEFLERCVEILDREPEVVVCYSKTNLINENGEVIEKYSDGLHLRSKIAHERFKVLLFNFGWCNPIFGLMRRKILEKTPLIGDYPYSDRKLLAELTLHGEFYEIPEYLFYRRDHPMISTTVNLTERELATWYNPKTRKNLNFPIMRRYYEYLRTTLLAPISPSNKIHCIYYLLQLFLHRRVRSE